MRRQGLSKTRERIFTFIKKFYREHDYAPTVRDILKGCSLSSTAVVQHHLNVLEKEGRIHRDPEVFRSIRLAEKIGISGVPLLGTIAAGEPIPVPTPETWANQSLETLEIPEELTGGITATLCARRGKIIEMDSKGRTCILVARVPLGEMFGYSTELRNVTSGRGDYTAERDQWLGDEDVGQLAAKIIEARHRTNDP